ncbi:MAG TPA: RNA polymerase sigma factor [Steroidobacteraceae bacterium]|nr:RNA polymerase sigma factor [Steroidobacteraceae bacterium]
MSDSSAADFDRLLRGHVRPLYRYAYRWTGDVDQAEDLVQETLTRLYSELPRLREVEQLRPWVARVMYRIFVDWLRRANRSPVVYAGRSGSTGEFPEDEEEDDQAPDETWNPEALTERAFERERIEAAWAHLQKQHRVVLSLHEIEGYSLEEVAHIIDTPLGTAKSRLSRARNRLRQLLTEGTNSPAPTCIPPETS